MQFASFGYGLLGYEGEAIKPRGDVKSPPHVPRKVDVETLVVSYNILNPSPLRK